ncbi:hypothetical protein [Amycolatopsis sp. lyj-108]|uniref:hypothetical protein n=1 Tax=Amycolatopsis sp. lyj-108 TaxID=2789286 RepID=UPI00397B8E5D
MCDDEHRRWWAEAGNDPRPAPPGWWPETDTLFWVRTPATDAETMDGGPPG